MAKAGRVAVLGLGKGGGQVAVSLAEKKDGLCEVAVADTDAGFLEALPLDRKVLLGSEWTSRDGCGGDAVLGERAASASVKELRSFLADSRLVIVSAGLGGGTGSGAVKVLARLLRESEQTALFLVTTPFAFEGSWRRQEADRCLAQLRSVADGVIVVPNDLLFTTLPADTPAAAAFSLADSLLAEAVAGLARLPSAQGLISADFASVRSLLRHRHATCAVGVGRGSGDERWRQAIDQFLACPLVGGRDTLAQADAAVVTLMGGSDLFVGEIQTCLAAFEQYFEENIRLVVGAYTDPAFDGQLQITGLVCKYQDSQPAPTSAEPRPTAKDEEAQRRRSGKRGKGASPKQGVLPFLEQTLGVFSGCNPTTVGGQNLDIPTFQRRGVQLDVGD